MWNEIKPPDERNWIAFENCGFIAVVIGRIEIARKLVERSVSQQEGFKNLMRTVLLGFALITSIFLSSCERAPTDRPSRRNWIWPGIPSGVFGAYATMPISPFHPDVAGVLILPDLPKNNKELRESIEEAMRNCRRDFKVAYRNNTIRTREESQFKPFHPQWIVLVVRIVYPAIAHEELADPHDETSEGKYIEEKLTYAIRSDEFFSEKPVGDLLDSAYRMSPGFHGERSDAYPDSEAEFFRFDILDVYNLN